MTARYALALLGLTRADVDVMTRNLLEIIERSNTDLLESFNRGR